MTSLASEKKIGQEKFPLTRKFFFFSMKIVCGKFRSRRVGPALITRGSVTINNKYVDSESDFRDRIGVTQCVDYSNFFLNVISAAFKTKDDKKTTLVT